MEKSALFCMALLPSITGFPILCLFLGEEIPLKKFVKIYSLQLRFKATVGGDSRIGKEEASTLRQMLSDLVKK